MKLILVPMRPNNTKQCLAGNKTATTRTFKLGDVGDCFQLGGGHFQITNVTMITLGEVATKHYKDEGFSSTQEFINEWKQIHPIKGYVHSWLVCYHEFRRL